MPFGVFEGNIPDQAARIPATGSFEPESGEIALEAKMQ
jgi:hypothetical protein